MIIQKNDNKPESQTWIAYMNRKHIESIANRLTHRELTHCTELKPQTAHKNTHPHIQSLSNQSISKLSSIHAELSHPRKCAFRACSDSKGPDQTAFSLIRAFAVCCQNHWILWNVSMESKDPNKTLNMRLLACLKTQFFSWCSPTLYSDLLLSIYSCLI